MKIWKDIPGYEGLYQASKWGEIKSLKRIVFNGVRNHILKGRILKPIPNGTGYFSVCLRLSNQTNRLYVHRLIAITFIKTEDYSLEVNHIDGDRSNNTLTNLEWVTRSTNHFHRYKVLKQSGVNKGKIGALNWCSKPVNMMDPEGVILKTYAGVMEAARAFNINEASIRCAISGRSKYCKGYKWAYSNEQKQKSGCGIFQTHRR